LIVVLSVLGLGSRLDAGWLFLVRVAKIGKREGGEKPLSRWLFAMLKLFFCVFRREIKCQEGEKKKFDVSNRIDYK
jgi:hypothetical protein